MGANGILEKGSNSGSDFAISNFNDMGDYMSTPFSIQRSTGNVGIGTVSPSSTLQVVDATKASTLTIGEINKSIACLKMVDSNKSGYTYCTFLSGVMTCSTKDCSK
jgi:hypothetical protein